MGLHHVVAAAGIFACPCHLVGENVPVPFRRSTQGSVAYHDGQCATALLVRYGLATDWMIASELEEWRSIAERRRKARPDRPTTPTREVLYGTLRRYLVDQCLSARHAGLDDPIVEIHRTGCSPTARISADEHLATCCWPTWITSKRTCPIVPRSGAAWGNARLASPQLRRHISGAGSAFTNGSCTTTSCVTCSRNVGSMCRHAPTCPWMKCVRGWRTCSANGSSHPRRNSMAMHPVRSWSWKDAGFHSP